MDCANVHCRGQEYSKSTKYNSGMVHLCVKKETWSGPGQGLESHHKEGFFAAEEASL